MNWRKLMMVVYCLLWSVSQGTSNGDMKNTMLMTLLISTILKQRLTDFHNSKTTNKIHACRNVAQFFLSQGSFTKRLPLETWITPNSKINTTQELFTGTQIGMASPSVEATSLRIQKCQLCKKISLTMSPENGSISMMNGSRCFKDWVMEESADAISVNSWSPLSFIIYATS